jgi:hypothetical protein
MFPLLSFAIVWAVENIRNFSRTLPKAAHTEVGQVKPSPCHFPKGEGMTKEEEVLMTRKRSLPVILAIAVFLMLAACTPKASAHADHTIIQFPTPIIPSVTPSYVPLPENTVTPTPLLATPTSPAVVKPASEMEVPESVEAGVYECCAGNRNVLDYIDPPMRVDYLASEEINDRPAKEGSPSYHGMYQYYDEAAGYGLWLPSDWYPTSMGNAHQGVIFSPYPGDIYTAFIVEKYLLDGSVSLDDLPALQAGFEGCIQSLPGVEIESLTYTPTDTLIMLEARYSYLDGVVRRERWVREVYWNEAMLVLVAQGATVDEFEYWLPMFYNTMVTVTV